jgi:GTP pyrophosphokinase
MEVQIRTQEMHRIAEQGIAAHWKYKEKKSVGSSDGQAFAWLRQLMEWQRDLKDPTEFLETVKIDLFQDEVFVFTPKGDVKALPKGSTPIDFAFAVHSKVGEMCSGARVNGLIVPLRYALRNGDTVDILTSPSQKPSKDWLKFVATSRAQTKIRHFLRMEQRDRSRQMGHDLLGRELRKRGFGLPTMEREGLVEQAAARLHLGSSEDLLVAVGYGKLTVEQAANAIAPKGPSEGPATVDEARGESPLAGLRRAPKRAVGGIRVQGESDIVVKFAKCCSPVPGDSIIGFISRGHGVSIHTHDCSKAMALDPARRVDVSWDDDSRTLRPVTVEVQAEDRPGLLASISRAFTENGVNISQAKCRTSENGKAVNTFQVSVGHVDQLKTVLRSLQGIVGVVSAERR